MKLVEPGCDIAILTTEQAWENYCTALHLAEAHRFAENKAKFHGIAQQSLDRYFSKLEQKLKHQREWDAA